MNNSDLPEQNVCENEFSPDQQLWNQEENSGLKWEESEPSQVKEEQEVKLEASTFMVTPISEENKQTKALNCEQLLPHNSPLTEVWDEEGSQHEDFGSTKEEEKEPKPKNRRMTTRSQHEDGEKTKKSNIMEEAFTNSQDLSEGESNGECSDFSDEDWVAEESSDSDFEPEPPWKKTKKSLSIDTMSQPTDAQPLRAAVQVGTTPRPTSSTEPTETEVLSMSARAPSPDEDWSSCERGEDGTMWKAIQPGELNGEQARRRQSQNILTESAGPTAHAKCNIDDALSTFLCLVDREMLQHIRDCTVAEAHRVQQSTKWDISVEELRAFIALLYVRGAYNKNLDMVSFWSEEWGLPFFRETMPRSRFREIMRHLCFDKKDNRHTGSTDKFVSIVDMWDLFVANCGACYKPGANITVDEQLFPTKAQCRFIRRMANKLGKFGIKFWLAADVETKYLVSGFPDLGRDEMQPPHQSLGESVAMRLVEPYVGKGRNVTTTNNFFTSLSLAKNLLKKNTSLVGTIDKNRRELPPSVLKREKLFLTKVLKHESASLTVYQGKLRKSVALLSTLHQTVAIGSDQKRKPETVTFYNVTKTGVATLVQMARLYSVKGPTRRWQVAVFCNLLDMAAINAHILFKECTSSSIQRRAFILQLAKELRADHLHLRNSVEIPKEPQTPRIRQCQVRSHCKENKTWISCKGCKRAICKKCTMRTESFCPSCAF
ncbi:piggyBac transposable element-derived protein 4-like [Pholidichthys leucotaenia]